MFTIKGKQKFGGVNVDGAYIAFVNGIGTTNDAEVAAKLKAKGYIVEGGTDATVPADPLTALTVNELKAYASENGIDLQGATKKNDIIALLNKAAENEVDDSDETEDEDSDDETEGDTDE